MEKDYMNELIDIQISMEKNWGQYLEKQKKNLKKERKKIKKLEENILISEAILINNGNIKLVQNEQRFNTKDKKIIKWLYEKNNCIKAKNKLEAMENSLKCEIINYYIPVNYFNYIKKKAIIINELQNIIILYFVYDRTLEDISKYFNYSLSYVYRKIQNINLIK